MGDRDRHIGIKAENGQLKVGISSVVETSVGVRKVRHRASCNRTIDPQVPRPYKFTPELCREMGGAMLVTIYETIRKTEESAKQMES